MRTLIELKVQDGASSTVALQAEVQQPDVCLLSCEVTLNEVFIGVPTYHQLTLINKTLLTTEFEWGKLQFCPSKESIDLMGDGDCASTRSTRLHVPVSSVFNENDYDFYSISFNPHAGVIGPREQVVVEMCFFAHRMFAIPDFRVECQIKEMDSPLYLAIYGFVSGPDIAFQAIPVADSADDCTLDFGSEVALGSNPTRQISVKNHTAIATRYKLSLRTFPGPRTPTPPGPRADEDPVKSRSNRILARTPNLADPLSQTPEKAHSDLCKIVLQDNRGVAFTIEPSEGLLAPYESITATVTAFSDMWGTYSDIVNCQTISNDGASNRWTQLPVKMTIVGCPIYFQMTSPQSRGQAPKLRFGTHVCGAPPITRHMKIINSGPVDIRLDWNIYKEDKASQKLLDVTFLFGTILPLLDSEGNEILPPCEEPERTMHRHETGVFLIPDSPDSTPPSTREATDTEMDPTTQDMLPHSQLIQLLLRPHDGVEQMPNNGPYSIEPSQLVIRARRHGTINITFTPLKCDVLESGVDCNGYAHGYMSLDAANAQMQSRAARLEKYDVQPLRLDMTAHCKPAQLTIECIDDDEMTYRAAASDLLDTDGQATTEKLKLSNCTISNNTLTPLTFTLSTTMPFYIMAKDAGRGRRHDNRMLQMQQLTLYPRQNIMVHVAFRLSTNLLNYVDGAIDEGAEMFKLEQSGSETKLHFRRQLVVSFSNGTEQTMPLAAIVYVPSLQLSKDSLDFGKCLVAQERRQQLILSNPSCSDCQWIAELESMSDNCTETTFEVRPSTGHLDAYSTCVANNKVLLTISFHAKHAEEYTAFFVFRGILGEKPRRLMVRGQGSYDGLFEAQVNV
ncbi:Deleted in lung and esophageal cancer protein 1 [Lamellibrachia satsuma]|nr:Deleted in lung and esophageal cancer protein 1 [Lamellibrachia satsuma]